jgi:hypothetical protein
LPALAADAPADEIWSTVRRGSASAATLMREMPEERLLRTSDERTPIGLAALCGHERVADDLERIVLDRLRLVVEVLYVPTAAREELAREAVGVLRSVWPSLRVNLRPKERKAGVDPLHVIWIERWGVSRRSIVLASQAAGAPLPSVRAMVESVRRKLEGKGMLPMG